MVLKVPESMDELVYWTSRALGSGYVKAWAYREDCPKCKKAKMGKPKNAKGGIMIRAKHYECPECHNIVEKEEYEDTLTACIIYTCPKCSFQGETEVPYRRKKIKGVDSLLFECGKCKEKIQVTKKMKAPK